MNTLLLEQTDAVARIILHRPAQLNALNEEMLDELRQTLTRLADDPHTRVVVLQGAGDKAFAAGADIAAMQAMTVEQARDFAERGQRVFSALEHLPQPTIAAVQGFALGGGCELALACDIRIASERARFGQPEVTLGITAGFGGTQRLPRLIGRGQAARLLYSGSLIDAAEALSLGLVEQVTPPEKLDETVMELAKTIAANSPTAVRQTKRCLREGLEAPLKTGLAYEAQAFGLCFSTSEQKDAMQAFLHKRR